MLPNSAVHESFGKLFFIALDLLAGYLILIINRLDRITSSRDELVALVFALFNPITVAISSRGNAESIMACLVLAFIYYLKRHAYVQAGLIYGLAIHFKIYPITYALVILLHLIRFPQCFTNLDSFKSRVLLNSGLYKFAISSFAILVSFTYLFYLK